MPYLTMRTLAYCTGVVGCAAIAICALHAAKSSAHAGGVGQPDAGAVSAHASPIYGVTIPTGYRDWKLIAVNQILLAGKLDQLRAQLGNDIAIKAMKDGRLPYPDGSMIVAIHWTRVPSTENNRVINGPFPGTQSFVIGAPVNVQFMVKDSNKYAATGGWGFGDFTGNKPGSRALHETCFACHYPAKDRDFVFARYAPVP
jgi:hypothetical protein